jgi:hypothetical protein
VFSGALVVATGAGFLYFGRNLTIGTASHMGSGYFPFMLSILMIVFGLAIIVNTLRVPRGDASTGPVPWRTLALIMGAIVFFAVTLKGLGIFPALFISTLAAASASRYAGLRASILLALVVTVFCVGVFIYALGLQIPVFGRWWSPEFWSTLAAAQKP